MRRVATILLALAVLHAPAVAGAQGVELNDIEDEVMCPICGTLLELSNSPQAQREKAFVARMIAAGRTKEEIKSALVAQYGSQVLALPDSSGFDLSAYLVPAIALVIAIAALAVGVARWRRQGLVPAQRNRDPGPLENEDSERLDADRARYDL